MKKEIKEMIEKTCAIVKSVFKPVLEYIDKTPVKDVIEKEKEAIKKIKIPNRVLVTIFTVLVAVLLLMIMFHSYLFNPWTRDGQVRAQIIQVAPRVSGPIITLNVHDNAFVKKGDSLFKIDPRTFQADVEEAEASLAQSRDGAAESKDKADRAQNLYKKDKGAISQLTLVAKQNEFRGAKDAVKVAESNLKNAKLNLEFTEVYAPSDGYVTNLKLRVGSNVVANQPALALVDTNSFWVHGFFKETQIANIRPGDRAVVKLMSYPRKPIEGTVESIGWGIAQQDGSPGVDLLPDVNPSFDWIRLAQRIPVRVRIDKLPPGVELRVGTTASVFIYVRKGKIPKEKQK